MKFNVVKEIEHSCSTISKKIEIELCLRNRSQADPGLGTLAMVQNQIRHALVGTAYWNNIHKSTWISYEDSEINCYNKRRMNLAKVTD